MQKPHLILFLTEIARCNVAWINKHKTKFATSLNFFWRVRSRRQKIPRQVSRHATHNCWLLLSDTAGCRVGVDYLRVCSDAPSECWKGVQLQHAGFKRAILMQEVNLWDRVISNSSVWNTHTLCVIGNHDAGISMQSFLSITFSHLINWSITPFAKTPLFLELIPVAWRLRADHVVRCNTWHSLYSARK